MESIYSNIDYIKVFNKSAEIIEIGGFPFIKKNKSIVFPKMCQKYIVNDLSSILKKIDVYEKWEIKVLLTNDTHILLSVLNLSLKLKVNYTIDPITWSIEKLSSRNARSKFRRSLKNHSTVLQSKLNQEQLPLLSVSIKKYNVQEFINETTLDSLSQKFDCKVFVSYDQLGFNVGFAFCIVYNNRMYYLWGAGEVTSALINAISYCKEKSIKVFDFEGSSIKGVEKFYSHFNPTLETFVHVKKNNNSRFKFINRILEKLFN